jgi:N-methylhydantoinase A
MSEGWQVGIDIGGTFTDVVAFRPGDGPQRAEMRQAKVRSRPDDPVQGLEAALDSVGVAWGEVEDLVHGTTMVTNAIVENRLAEVALIATKGFADTIEIGRQNRRHLYRLDLPPKAPCQVPRERRFEVDERLDFRGTVLAELSEAEIEEVARQVAASGASAVAVSLLHAYANPAHERRLGERLRQVVPYVALSHQINPEAREYERSSTTALSASLMPLASRYLDKLEARRPDDSHLHLFHSAGGMAAPAVLRDLPLGLALSGPAAGVAAAEKIARALDIDYALSFDMGGTTSDVCLIAQGRAEVRSDRSLGERPLRQPMVAVESIGAGGGSIARLDHGALRVGPESAGAEPGPACYGRGGERPTVSDANLLLGYLTADHPVGGGLRLEVAAAERVLAPLAEEIGVGLPEAALGVVRVANASMARALRRVTVERGIDGRHCTLLAFGGAGPMHAVELARSFGIGKVIVPQFSSAFSALGCVTAEMSYTLQQTLRMASTAWDEARLQALRDSLRDRLATMVETADGTAPRFSEVAALRYSGQSYAVEIFDPALDDVARLAAEFLARHEALYGFATDEPWELVSLRTTAAVLRPDQPNGPVGSSDRAIAAKRVDDCWFGGEVPVATPRYDRATLAAGHVIAGPAIVEDAWSTVVLPPDSTLSVDQAGHLHIDVGSS